MVETGSLSCCSEFLLSLTVYQALLSSGCCLRPLPQPQTSLTLTTYHPRYTAHSRIPGCQGILFPAPLLPDRSGPPLQPLPPHPQGLVWPSTCQHQRAGKPEKQAKGLGLRGRSERARPGVGLDQPPAQPRRNPILPVTWVALREII